MQHDKSASHKQFATFVLRTMVMVVNPYVFVHEVYVVQDNSVSLPSQPINEPIVVSLLANCRENRESHENSEDSNNDKEDVHAVR